MVDTIRFIVKKEIYDGKIVDIWTSRRQCAKDMGVTENAIYQALTKRGKCKNYYLEYIEIDKRNLLNTL